MFRSKIIFAASLVLIVLLIGATGYHFIWGAGWVDAFYMTIITVSTVGYEQVIPLDNSGKLFTVFLIIVSLFTFGFAVSVISQYLLSINNIAEVILRRKMKEISKLEGHIILCGYGRNGKEAAAKLKIYKKPFLVIEKDQEVIQKYELENDILFLQGDSTDDIILEKAGISRASTVITTLPNDAENLFVVLTARQMNKSLMIISRASEESSVAKLKLGGADKVVMPDNIGGDHMAALIVVPELIEFLSILELQEDASPNLEQIAVNELPAKFIGQSLAELNIRKETGCTVIGVKTPNGSYIVNPDTDFIMEPHSVLIVLGRPDQIKRMKETFHI